jgi:hypothetical protein
MPDLDRIRELYPDPPLAPLDVRHRAQLALVARMDGRSRRRFSRRLLLSATGLAVAVFATAVVLVGVGKDASVDPAAAAVLREAAAKLKAQEPPLGQGRVLYVKSIDAYLSSSADDRARFFAVLVPHVRELWQGPDGGLLDTRSGEPKFLSERDRERWITAGRPNLRDAGVGRTRLERQDPSDLPTDAGALFSRLEDEARGHSQGTHRQMFTRLGDHLRETNISPRQRAALYEVAAKIPGVELVGRVRDPVGRTGLAVAMTYPSSGTRAMLVIDPETGVLLAEQNVTLADNFYGYPAGTVVGHATYVVTRMVDAVGDRPK